MIENGPILYTPKPKPCRHRHFWIFASLSAKMLWCYQCGAVKNGYDRWVRPTGVDGANPAMKGH